MHQIVIVGLSAAIARLHFGKHRCRIERHNNDYECRIHYFNTEDHEAFKKFCEEKGIAYRPQEHAVVN